MSGGLKTAAPLLAVLLVVAFQVWKRVKHKPGVRDVVDPLKLKLPVFGPLLQKIALARFARNLGTMMKSGVPILQALEIVVDDDGQRRHRAGDHGRPGERPDR